MYSKIAFDSITDTLADVTFTDSTAGEQTASSLVHVYNMLNQDVEIENTQNYGPAQSTSVVIIPALCLGFVFPELSNSMKIRHLGSEPTSGSIYINKVQPRV